MSVCICTGTHLPGCVQVKGHFQESSLTVHRVEARRLVFAAYSRLHFQAILLSPSHLTVRVPELQTPSTSWLLMWFLGIKLRSSGLHSYAFYLTNHLPGPCVYFYNYYYESSWYHFKFERVRGLELLLLKIDQPNKIQSVSIQHLVNSKREEIDTWGK